MKLEKLIGKKVIVSHRGLLLVGELKAIENKFGGRAIVQLPMEKKPRRFWASKVSEIKD